MDYLDPKRQVMHSLGLFAGYILTAIAITMAAIILLYQAYGFGIGKNGAVVQNGLLFFSSQPHPASIYLNGKLNSSTTNTQLELPEGIYRVSLSRSGYVDWQRTIELKGSTVEHFDYPLLIPKKLDTSKIQTYTGAPSLATQSPDKRWFIISKPGSLTDFDVYDLKNPAKAPLSISLPSNVLTKATISENLRLVEWADDNQHVLLQHNFDGKSEYILLNRTAPDQSVNLSTVLSLSSHTISLRNKKFDQYYLYDSVAGTLQEATLKSSDKTIVLQHVLAYKSYGDSDVLYITDLGAPAGKALVKILHNGQKLAIHSIQAAPAYVLNLTQYSGTLYVAVGSSASSSVYIYKDPVAQLGATPGVVVPAQVLHVASPNYLSFSQNAQFIVTENGSHFGVYDIENDKGYSYTTDSVPDAPMQHAEWMDGDRLYFISGGKLDIFDYDHTNQHILASASGSFLPAFAPNYKFVDTMVANPSGQIDMNQTWLLVPADR